MYRSIVPCCVLLVAACGDDKQTAPPVVRDLAVTTAEDTPVAVTVPLTAADANAVTLTVTTPPGHGALAGNGPTWTYTPAANFSGADTFAVRAEDRIGASSATVSITVTAADDAPIANADTFMTPFNTALTVAQATLLANDTDVDNATLTVTAVAAGADGHGIPTLSGTDVVFTPTTGFHGAAAFSYTISDGSLTAQGTVNITVGDDLAPVAVADATTVAEASVANPIDVLANDTDPDGGPRSVMSVTQPGHGAAAVTADGLSVTYTPATGYCNEAPNAPRDGFTYMLIGGSSAAVSIKVTCACGLHKPTDFVVGVAP